MQIFHLNIISDPSQSLLFTCFYIFIYLFLPFWPSLKHKCWLWMDAVINQFLLKVRWQNHWRPSTRQTASWNSLWFYKRHKCENQTFVSLISIYRNMPRWFAKIRSYGLMQNWDWLLSFIPIKHATRLKKSKWSFSSEWYRQTGKGGNLVRNFFRPT